MLFSKSISSESFVANLFLLQFLCGMNLRFKFKMVQGSILGPMLYAIFFSLLFDLAKMTLFADENYALHQNKQLPT